MLRQRPRIARGLVVALFLTYFVGLHVGQSPAFAAAGDSDTSLTLNGTNQYAEVADPGTSAFDLTGNFTIEAWTYAASTCSTDQTIVAKNFSYMMYCGSGLWKYAYSANGSTWIGDVTTIKVDPNAWHHLAYSHSASASNVKIYYDGQLVETVTANVPSTLTPNDLPFQVGRYSTNNYFNGKIDEVRIYNAIRTDVQILNDSRSYGATSDTNLIAYYDFNDESGSTISNADATPAANTDLTIYGSPSYTTVESTSVVNGDQVITFPRSYLTANGGWKIPSHVSSTKVLVVAGGGAGGSRAGGGGGAGGYVYDTAVSVSPNSYQSVVVGAGGVGYVGRQGTNGQNSSLGSLKSALGGGGGGSAGGVGNGMRVGLDGGSGGGASGDYSTPNSSAAFGYGRQSHATLGFGYGSGNNGGSGYNGNGWASGGGGGAYSAGLSSDGPNSIAGKGGNGFADPIGGTSTCYATGGGGGVNSAYPNGAGAGGNCGGLPVNNDSGTVGSVFPGYALANTGSGGGGGGWSAGTDPIGGMGASGVIILRYPLLMTVTLSYSGGTAATYRTVGTITATGSLAGKVTFYERGKAIPGCVRVSMNGSNVATCSWKPSLHGSTTITATAKPSNTYVPNGSTSLNLAVIARSNKR